MIIQRNQLDNMIGNARRALAEIGKSFPLDVQIEMNGTLNSAEQSISNADSAEIKRLINSVEEIAGRITEAMLMTV